MTLNDATIDLDTGDVWLPATPRRRLQHQPLLVLRALVSHPGVVVTRDELRAVVWATDTHVDFEHGLNYCVRQLRATLGDDARGSRFIETLPRRGYRLVASVGIPRLTAHTDGSAAHASSKGDGRGWTGRVWVGSLVVLVAALMLPLAYQPVGPALSFAPASSDPAGLAAPASSTAAWDHFVRARGLLTRATGSDIDAALGLLDQAIAVDARFAAAQAARADALVLAALQGLRAARPALERAERAVRTALELEPNAPAALATLATIRFRAHWDWRGAERLFARALGAPGGGATVYRDHAWFLAATGRRPEAVAAMRAALALDPGSARINSEAAWIFTRVRHYDDAIAQVERALALEPALRGLEACLECAYVNTGRFGDAVDAIKASAPVGTRFGNLPSEPRQALAVLERHRLDAVLRERGQNPTTSAYLVAVQSAAAGDDRAAAVWLERALLERDPGLAMILADPIWDRLRDDPRVVRVTRAVGLRPGADAPRVGRTN